jgi:hypothetical protein
MMASLGVPSQLLSSTIPIPSSGDARGQKMAISKPGFVETQELVPSQAGRLRDQRDQVVRLHQDVAEIVTRLEGHLGLQPRFAAR